MLFLVKFLPRLVLIILLILTASCQSDAIDPNAVFEEKYGEEITKRRKSDVENKKHESLVQNQMTPFGSVAKGDVSYLKSSQGYFPYVNISKFGDRMLTNNSPSAETYQQVRSNPSNKLPTDIFETHYYTRPYPPSQYADKDFDRLFIPSYDAYGVPTALSKKSYLLTGNNTLQKSIDQINVTRTDYDIMNSETLVSEQKELRRQQKMIKIFGSADPVEFDYEYLEYLEGVESGEDKKDSGPKEQIAQNMDIDPVKKVMTDN